MPTTRPEPTAAIDHPRLVIIHTRQPRPSETSSKYEFIDAEYAARAAAENAADAPTITEMCSWLGVSRSGFYDWEARPESATAARRNELKVMIGKAFEDSLLLGC